MSCVATSVLLFLLAALFLGGYIGFELLFARFFAIRDGKREMPLIFGLARLVLWEQNEGVVILKYKKVSDVLAGDGGTRLIFPILGEEVRARVPLTLHMITWTDDNVLTRESIRVKMKVAVWWRVNDLSKYVFSIDRDAHVEKSHVQLSPLAMAEMWLMTLTESSMRTLASESSVALLVSSKATQYLRRDDHVKDDGPMPSDALARELAIKAADYGLEIQRVEVQEINLSREIQESIDRVWRASMLPAQSEQEARARQIELRSLAEVLGTDTVALKETLQSLQGSNFMGVPSFLDSLFARVGERAAAPSLAARPPPQLGSQTPAGAIPATPDPEGDTGPSGRRS